MPGTTLCFKCPNNPLAIEKSMELVEIKVPMDCEKSACDICRGMLRLHVMLMTSGVCVSEADLIGPPVHLDQIQPIASKVPIQF